MLPILFEYVVLFWVVVVVFGGFWGCCFLLLGGGGGGEAEGEGPARTTEDRNRKGTGVGS